jgi:hypothetical protein
MQEVAFRYHLKQDPNTTGQYLQPIKVMNANDNYPLLFYSNEGQSYSFSQGGLESRH